jgi:hypothetical protein
VNKGSGLTPRSIRNLGARSRWNGHSFATEMRWLTARVVEAA